MARHPDDHLTITPPAPDFTRSERRMAASPLDGADQRRTRSDDTPPATIDPAFHRRCQQTLAVTDELSDSRYGTVHETLAVTVDAAAVTSAWTVRFHADGALDGSIATIRRLTETRRSPMPWRTVSHGRCGCRVRGQCDCARHHLGAHRPGRVRDPLDHDHRHPGRCDPQRRHGQRGRQRHADAGSAGRSDHHPGCQQRRRLHADGHGHIDRRHRHGEPDGRTAGHRDRCCG